MEESIKKQLQTRFLSEEKSAPGISQTADVQKLEKKINKDAQKEIKISLDDYEEASTSDVKDNIVPPKRDLSKDEETLRNYGTNGLGDIAFDGEVGDDYKKRQEMAIAGDALMGNSPEYANVVTADQQGFTGPEFGKEYVKGIKANKKLKDKSTTPMVQFGDDVEITDGKTRGASRKVAVESVEGQKLMKQIKETLKVKDNKEKTIKENTMKRLKFKKPFNGMEKALKLIPEGYKVDDKEFEMTDGNETYRVKWEGSLTEGTAIVLRGENKQFVNEDMAKIKHLFGYKSEDTLGLVKGSARVDENKAFSDVWDKTKSLLTESDDEDDDEATLPLDKLARESEEVAEGEEITEEEDINGGAKTTEKKPDEKLPQAADAKKDVIKGVVAEEEIEEADEITEDDVEEGCEDKK